MLYQILSLATRKDVLGEPLDERSLMFNLPTLIQDHRAVIIQQHPTDFDPWVKGKSGELRYYDIQPDCDENEGGYYVQVYSDEDLDDLYDYFCVHPDDCDCEDEDAVEVYVREYIRENY